MRKVLVLDTMKWGANKRGRYLQKKTTPHPAWRGEGGTFLRESLAGAKRGGTGDGGSGTLKVA